jgi:hypothetical protein
MPVMIYNILAQSNFSNKSELDRIDRSLLCGLLLVGRLSWLLQSRGSFLVTAIRPPKVQQQTHTSNGNSHASLASGTMAGWDGEEHRENKLNVNSEDQFQSAFEIVDADGDGVITFEEAVEVSVIDSMTWRYDLVVI